MESFEVTSGAFIVSDPDHKRGERNEHQPVLLARNGKWTAETIRHEVEEPTPGETSQVDALLLGHEDFDLTSDAGCLRALGCYIAIDSASVGVFDLATYPGPMAEQSDGPERVGEHVRRSEASESLRVVDGHGVVSSSRGGNGFYPLYGVRDDRGRLIALGIPFLGE